MATSGSAPRGARGSASASGQGDTGTRLRFWRVGGPCRFPWREGVARGGSRCPACPDLQLGRCAPGPRGGRDWRLEGAGICDLSHLGTESGPGVAGGGASWLSQRTCPGRADGGSPGGRTPRPSAAEHTSSWKLSFTCSALLTFLFRALGAASPPLSPGRCQGPAAALDPYQWGKGDPAEGWRSGREGSSSWGPRPQGCGVCNLQERTAVSHGLGGAG